MAAQRIIAGEGDVFVAGGVESISCVQQEMNQHMLLDPALQENKPEIYWTMLQTAENVAKRYGIASERMDHYGAGSQQKACAAQEAGLFKDEIVPDHRDRRRGRHGARPAQQGSDASSADEGLRAGTTYEGISGIRSAMPGGVVTAGNASQFSDGAGACVVMQRDACRAEGPEAAGPLPRLRRGRLRARRDGHRPGLRRAQGAAARWA